MLRHPCANPIAALYKHCRVRLLSIELPFGGRRVASRAVCATIGVNQSVSCLLKRLEEAGITFPSPHVRQQDLGARACAETPRHQGSAVAPRGP